MGDRTETSDSSSYVDRNRLWARLKDAVDAHGSPLSTPLMVVDLDAFDANADDLVRRAGGKPVRVASKSVRVPALLRRALARDGFQGVLAYTLAEALWLEEEGISDDVVVAYPSVDRRSLARLVESPRAAGRVISAAPTITVKPAPSAVAISMWIETLLSPRATRTIASMATAIANRLSSPRSCRRSSSDWKRAVVRRSGAA